ncbi:dihydroxyacetone kinase subunit DhaL [Streptomyces mexicanus]|jgi:dihydroxyacetone kinase-like protein|uniref:dihydroxyacetone kinase subunit DhaL n=1 Tax=Streptomyces mexicanus TaxID=178566 RepID=UPI0036CE04C7
MTDTIDTALAVAWMRTAAHDLTLACGRLTDLDAARGDADHGTNMQRGFAAIAEHLGRQAPATPGAALLQASAVLRRTMGGTSGPLWSAALRRAGKALGEGESAPPSAMADALDAAAAAIADIGGAQEGDNTMLDALLPAARALRARLTAGEALPAAAEAAAAAADTAAAETAGHTAHKGRASYLGERVLGHADPGAVSAALVIRALHHALTTR